ncbi:2476_t:CDS:1, partial [Funneliformis caledonium]
LSNPVNSNRLKDQYIINNFRLTGHKSSSPLDSALMVDWASLWTPPESNYYNLPYP